MCIINRTIWSWSTYSVIRSTVLAKWVLVRCTRQLEGRHSLCLQPELCRQIPTFWPLLIHTDVSTISISWAYFILVQLSVAFMAVHAPVIFSTPFTEVTDQQGKSTFDTRSEVSHNNWRPKYFSPKTTSGPKLPPLWWFCICSDLNANIFVTVPHFDEFLLINHHHHHQRISSRRKSCKKLQGR